MECFDCAIRRSLELHYGDIKNTYNIMTRRKGYDEDWFVFLSSDDVESVLHHFRMFTTNSKFQHSEWKIEVS